MEICVPLIWSMLVTSRTVSTTRRILLPRTGGKDKVTVWLAPGCLRSLIGGTVSVSTRRPSTISPRAVGTE